MADNDYRSAPGTEPFVPDFDTGAHSQRFLSLAGQQDRAGGEVGLSLFYWWYHTLDKTAAVFVVLVYVVACTVGGLILALVPGRPLITALSLGVMSGPFASVAAAAPLYGYYYCERMSHCLVGVIPY